MAAQNLHARPLIQNVRALLPKAQQHSHARKTFFRAPSTVAPVRALLIGTRRHPKEPRDEGSALLFPRRPLIRYFPPHVYFNPAR